MQTELQKNLAIYPWYQAATGFLPWMPVFFLFFSDLVSLTEAIELGAIYYLAVVFLEIPSGYLSDRVGRRTTLMTAAFFATCAYSIYLFATTFEMLLAAQILLAGAIAFQSGSDNSILYDSLIALDQQEDYTSHEARSQQFHLLSLSISVLIGGVLGSLHLKLPYFAAFIAAVFACYFSYSFVEPEKPDDSKTKAFLPQLVTTIKSMGNPVLLWILFFYVVGYALQHVPYEFYQPYIALLKSDFPNSFLSSLKPAFVSGTVIGISMFGGALAARFSKPLTDRFGALSLLSSTILIQCLIVAGLSLWLHPTLLVLVLFRNFSMSLAHAPMHSLIAPRVNSAIRATYLSMQSLAGRLVFSLSLFFVAKNTDLTQQLNWPTLSPILQTYAILGFGALIALVVTTRLISIHFRHVNRN